MLLRRLEIAWRSFGTMLFLAIIGIGGSALALTIFPVIALATRDPDRRQRRIQWVLHVTLKFYCLSIHWLKVADVEVHGAERLKQLKGTLIVANHPSLLDVVMIMAEVPNLQCVVKGALWKNPFFRLTVDGAGYIRNDLAPDELVQACVATLKAGNNLVVFPEGTRTTPDQPLRMQRGFANIATMAGADVQLLTITCEPPLLFKGNPCWRVPATRSKFRLEVGDRLDIQEFLRYRLRPQAARKLVAHLENYYAEKLAYGNVSR